MMNMALCDASQGGAVARTRSPLNAAIATVGIAAAVLWCVLSFIPPAFAEAGEQQVPAASASAPEIATTTDGTGTERIQARRPVVGMSLKEALALVGEDPDSQEEVGAACGMLDVLTWHEEGTRIISVDGTVTSIVDGKEQQP